LFIIYYKELFHRSLWSVPKVAPGWDPRNKIEKFSNSKKHVKHQLIFIKLEMNNLVHKPSTEQNSSNFRRII